MRDDNDYAGMSKEELRLHLASTAKQLASWEFALAYAKKQHARSFIEAYASSRGKSVAERVREGEMASVADQGEVLENEGNVRFHTVIRDLIVALLDA
jgi:hypothetical protein